MDKIDVVWLSYHEDILARGYWDQGLIEDIFKQGDYQHHTDFDWVDTTDGEGKLENGQGAIVIINGRTHINDTEQITKDISVLSWVLFIETGDEEAVFPWREVKHPLMKVWIQLPRMNVHDDVSFHLPNGYRPNTREILSKLEVQPRTIDYSFIGQVNHERRHQCVDVANQFKTVYPSAYIVGTDGFGKEDVPYADYLKILSKTKIALCPSGIESPDNFRLYEALEAGCVPVVDAFSTNFKTAGFWRYLFGDDIPFPIVNYWDELPDMLPMLLRDYTAMSQRCFSWWQLKKREIRYKLIEDVKELSK